MNTSLHQQGIKFHNSTSVYLKVKTTSGTAWICLQDNISSTIFKMYNVFLGLKQIAIRNILEKQHTSVPWTELQCNCYVSLWVSWIGGTIEVGGGSEIGTNRFTSLPINDSIAVTDILIKSHYTAYRLFDFLENSTSACTTDGPDGGLESNPETMNTTETTAPEFDPTSIIITDTTLPGLDQTTISTMETRTTGFTPTTLSTTETTSPGFNPTTISSIETNTPGFDQTSVGTIITRATTTSETTTKFETNKIPCICSCNNVTLTEDELITKIALLKSELSVDKKQTNKYRRSLISAEDDRPSSKYIGNFGIVVLVVKTSDIARIFVQENISSTKYKVYSVLIGPEHIIINDILEKKRTSVTWSELQCNCYVSLWVSWIGGTIEVGGGSEIGTNKLIHLPINHSIVVTDILIRSRYTAYWLFDFLEKASSVKVFL
ncbi:unnamed protein product [Mytilus edulis]|uniref:Farnesoic acid O-methyl transferase domain-containing protein n=1 Tax=Mytilus edulis TaxID=6550 RepID=A0A8S3UE12_MYTED|nr:unnamed protein product [Mytilus edulis]